jgi:hypothetical protein
MEFRKLAQLTFRLHPLLLHRGSTRRNDTKSDAFLRLKLKEALMRTTMIGTVFVALVVTPVLAQNPPAQSEPGNRAINSRDQNNANNPVAGANSFTEGQAKSRIESNGYTNVSGLKKDDQGVWRGKAQKDGKTTDVSLDFQGNVVAR